MATQKIKLLFYPLNILAHYVRCFEFAKLLPAADFDVYFVRGSYLNTSELTRYGITLIDAPNYDAKEAIEACKTLSFSWITNNLESRVLAQNKAIEPYQFDVLVGDCMPSLRLTAQMLQIDMISVTNAYMHPQYNIKRPLLPSALLGFARCLNWLPKPLFNIGEKLGHWWVHQPFKKLYKKYGLQPSADFLSEYIGDFSVITDDPKVFPLTAQNIWFAGPIIPKVEVPFTDIYETDWDVVITMGSTGNWWDVYGYAIHSSAKNKKILAVGDKARVLKGEHITHVDFADLSEVFQRTQQIVFHGGNGTAYLAAQTNAEVFVYPSFFEQYYNAVRFAELYGWEVVV